MGSGPGSPSGTKPPGRLFFGGFTDSPHSHKQETRGFDTIQATSFLGGYFSSFKKISRQREICKNPEIRKNPGEITGLIHSYKIWMHLQIFSPKIYAGLKVTLVGVGEVVIQIPRLFFVRKDYGTATYDQWPMTYHMRPRVQRDPGDPLLDRAGRCHRVSPKNVWALVSPVTSYWLPWSPPVGFRRSPPPLCQYSWWK